MYLKLFDIRYTVYNNMPYAIISDFSILLTDIKIYSKIN